MKRRAMLAIVAERFDAPSETFIRGHADNIFPAETALVALGPSYYDGFKGPQLALSGRYLFDWQNDWPIVRRFARALSCFLTFRLPQADRRRLSGFLHRQAVRVVLAEYGPCGVAIGRICAAEQIPFFVYFHGYDVNTLGQIPIWRWRYRRLARQAAGAIVTTPFLQRQLEALGLFADRIVVAPCSVDGGVFKADSNRASPNIVLAVSRLVRQKGIAQSLQAFAKARAFVPDLKLRIVGDGPQFSELKVLAEKLGLDDHVTFLGAQPHNVVLQEMQRAAVFVQHCVTLPFQGIESQGLSVLEAMACELPVVVTRHGALADAIVDGETGYLVEEYDIGQMASRIVELANNAALRKRVGQAARASVVETYAPERVNARLRAHLDAFLAKNKRSTDSDQHFS